MLSFNQHDRCHFLSFVMFVSGAKFEEHCFNISRDIRGWVLYYFSGTTYDVITFLICIIQNKDMPERKTPFFFTSLLLLYSNYFLLHRHFNISVQVTGCNPSHTLLSFWHSCSIILICVAPKKWKKYNICHFRIFSNIFLFLGAICAVKSTTLYASPVLELSSTYFFPAFKLLPPQCGREYETGLL